jgi:hypothetical protein
MQVDNSQEDMAVDDQSMVNQPEMDQQDQYDMQSQDQSGNVSFDNIDESHVPAEVNDLVKNVNKDKAMFAGIPSIAGPPSFKNSMNALETGDYQGLEHWNIGTVDGEPAVATTDEDGQAQVIRITMAQKMAILQARSLGRQQLQQAVKLDSVKKALKPQFESLLKMSPNSLDPVVEKAYQDLYDVDPQLAYNIAGSSLAKKQKTSILFGREVPEDLAKAQQLLSQRQYKGKVAQYDNLARGTTNIATLNGIQGVKNLIRPPEANHLPAEMTMSEWMDGNQMGAIPMLNAIQQSSMPMGIPNAPQALQPPVPDKDGQYNQKQFFDWAKGFNEIVVKPLGWSPYDLSNPSHVETLQMALHSYNASRMGAILTPPIMPTVQPRPYSERPTAAGKNAPVAETEQQTAKSPVTQDALTLLQQYGKSAFEDQYPQDDYPSDKKQGAVASLEAILKIHESNMENKKNGKPLNSAIPPDVAEKIYNAAKQK